MPLPVADLFEVLAVLGNVLLVLYQFVVHLLDQERTTIAKLRQMHHGIFHQAEAVKLVLDTHVERCRDGTFLLVTMNRHIVVVALVGQLMNQGRITVECEDNRLIRSKDCIVLCIA